MKLQIRQAQTEKILCRMQEHSTKRENRNVFIAGREVVFKKKPELSFSAFGKVT